MFDELSIYKPDGQYLDWQQIEPTFRLSIFDEQEQLFSNYLLNINKENIDSSPPSDTRAVSGYALFFRERQPTAKQRWPQANFAYFSKIIAAEWQGMTAQQKIVYKKRSEKLRKNQIRIAAMAKIRSVVYTSI